MPISNKSKKEYRLIGHALKPVVTIAGKGLTENVFAELERALGDHELIKIKLAIDDREARKETILKLCSHLSAELVQEIGKVALIYRASTKPELKTSNIR